jgi:hypothetical protein
LNFLVEVCGVIFDTHITVVWQCRKLSSAVSALASKSRSHRVDLAMHISTPCERYFCCDVGV